MKIALIMGRLKRSVKKTLLITQETSNKVENNDKIFRYFEKISELFLTCTKQKFYWRFDVIFEDYTNIMQIALIMGRLKRSVKKTLLITQETSNKVENNDKIFRYFEKISELFLTCTKQKFYWRFDVIFEDYTNIMQIALIMGRLKRSEKKTLLMTQETSNKVEITRKISKFLIFYLIF